MQVNSLGLTEQQPENNVYRILIEMLAVVLSKNARARAVQLPAWNEALGLPRPWDQQWSLRMQQIMAYETDLLEYGDLFDGNPAVEAKVEALKAGARAELARIDAMGGAVAAIDYMKSALVAANTARLARIEAGATIVVGVNRFTEAEPSPLTAGDGGILVVDPAVEAEQIARLAAWRAARDPAAVAAALADLRAAARRRRATSCPPRSPPPRPGVTTGEWGAAMREVFGEYRAPTGVGKAAAAPAGNLAEVRAAVEAASARLGRRIKFLVGKPGLDGHSNGAEQIAVRARDCGMEVRLRGHPPDPRPDRQRRARGERPRRRPLDPLRLAPAARHRDHGAHARGRPRRHPRGRRRHHPRRRRRRAARRRRRPRLHAEGLRAEPHHARHRRPRRRRAARRPDAGRRRRLPPSS